jgi:thiosulfate/3-mercaptopyruvate sulfurtransferase
MGSGCTRVDRRMEERAMAATVAPDTALANRGYVHPEVLVSTEWVAAHLNDPKVRLVESDEDILLYDVGHMPGAVRLDWHTDLQNPVERDFVDREGFEALMRKAGIANDTTVVFYGDRNNWYACYTFWLFKLYGHADCRVMDGGRAKWEAEGREYNREIPTHPETTYSAKEADLTIRAFREDVMAQVKGGAPALVDVRSPQEYTGEVIHMVGYPQEGAQRGGHVKGAQNIPWAQAANPDQTFKSADELKALYEGKGITQDKDVIAYCRIGERSSHTWFVLTYLLGYPNVRNYDGSWTEWGSMVNVPIEKGA